MLHHRNSSPTPPARTVVLGSGGFIGGAILRKLEASGRAVAGLGRKELDLLAAGAAERLASLLRRTMLSSSSPPARRARRRR